MVLSAAAPPTLSPGSSPGQALPHKGGGNVGGAIHSPFPLMGEGRGGGGATGTEFAT